MSSLEKEEQMDDSNDEEDSDSDVSEIEAMLYSQIHHSFDWTCEYEKIEDNCVTPNAQQSLSTELKDDSYIPLEQFSPVQDDHFECQHKNCSPEDDDDMIVLSSSDDTECEILDQCEVISKYSYCGSKNSIKSETKPAQSKDKKAYIPTSSTPCSASLYIHVNGDAESVTISDKKIAFDRELISVSSSDEETSNNRITKTKKQKNNAVSHVTEDDDIIEIPVPERKGDEWFVNAGDRYGRRDMRTQRRRDFHRRSLNVVCQNCNQRGHLSKICPVPTKNITCYICGYLGHHGGQCGHLVCALCWQSSHTSFSCELRQSMPYRACDVCQFPGHLREHCPDFWRRYHFTTSLGEIIPGKSLLKSKDAIYCSNCAQKGHFVHECQAHRMDFFIMPNRLDVASYTGLLPPPPLMAVPLTEMPKKLKSIGKFKQWKRNFKRGARRAVSFAARKFGRPFGFGNNFPQKFNRRNYQINNGNASTSTQYNNSFNQGQPVVKWKRRNGNWKNYNRPKFNPTNWGNFNGFEQQHPGY